ncbi:MAG TPA: tyrosine/phenylalanine carboxypeptidase domain-containing protein [Polyangiaceae bacterium]|jgi:uncharacterized protein (TIGR02421 family)|nr:tyrosine/phenylalanine carboxypeptidase domain-containing protein [Polyangiaceae bacterium]
MTTDAELDQRLVLVASKIRVLGALSFPEQTLERFLSQWHQGKPELPAQPPLAPPDAAVLEELRAIERQADQGHPLGRFLHLTAESYRKAVEMLSCTGTPTFHRLSREIYGGPDQRLPGTHLTQLEAADRLLAATAALTEATLEHDSDYCLTAEHVADELRRRVDAFFIDDKIDIVIDPRLSAKAAASATRVRIRGATAFSEMDIDQLAEHELFVHSASALNGRRQKAATALSLGAPRTTATQEGLATFAELITGAIDLARLRRIALRIRAVHLAEQGADFIDVFRYFMGAGQTELESVHSAMRIFRGGDVRGHHPFTKDVVYLRGLIGVHTFLHKAIAEVRPELVSRLFVGRLTTGDALALDELCDRGEILPPKYVPHWAQNIRALAAYLSFSGLLNDIDLDIVAIDELLRPPT